MNIINQINSLLWGFPVLILIIGGGIFLSFRLRFPQLHIIKIFRNTFRTLFAGKGSSDALSQLQGFSTALAAAVGTGSVVGVGAALAVGGKGAVFWLWVSAFVGMVISYSENFLGTKYGEKTNICGAMSYLKQIGRGKLLPLLYAGFSVLASLGMGNMAQASSVVSAAKEGFSLSAHLTAPGILIFTAFLLLGKNSAARLCEKLVPFMALFFICGSLFVIFTNLSGTFSAFMDIFREAFTLRSAAGGAVGTACIEGIKRGAFSNEAGLGSSVAIHSSCKIKSGEVQGVMGMAEVFIDTVIICTLTALVIIISGTELSADCAVKGYSAALGGFGKIFISVSLILFALATIAGWFFIGEKSWLYIFPRSDLLYRCIFLICAYLGAVYSPELVWGISDIFNGLMALPNMAGTLILSKEIVRPKFRPERDG